VSQSQSIPPSQDDFDETMATMKASLSALVDGSVGRPPQGRAGPPTARPVVSAGPPAAGMWGPPNPPVTTPMRALVQVADNARSLHLALVKLTVDITGREPPFRPREVCKLPNSLLPAISTLATEIDAVHSEIGQLIAQLRGEVS
jgi:hypothetical protein